MLHIITRESNCRDGFAWVFLRKFKGNSLELSILEHSLAMKNKLNNSAFILKSIAYLLS